MSFWALLLRPFFYRTNGGAFFFSHSRSSSCALVGSPLTYPVQLLLIHFRVRPANRVHATVVTRNPAHHAARHPTAIRMSNEERLDMQHKCTESRRPRHTSARAASRCPSVLPVVMVLPTDDDHTRPAHA
jgi:hypothetical protein